jgi:3-hexulose-6-phosphate synthase
MARPLIQLALDTLDVETTLGLARATADYIDIYEIGTPSIKYNGAALLKKMRAEFPNKKILVDLKTMDAGAYEAAPFYADGADIATVLGVSGEATIKGVIKAASENGGKQVQVDLINVPDKVGCAKVSAAAGAQIIGVHTGLDAQAAGQTPFADLQAIADLNLGVTISVAGGIKASTAAQVVKAGAGIIVVGAAIYGAADPKAAAKEIYDVVVAASA